jgi:outer membrane protein assembly factor BamB
MGRSQDWNTFGFDSGRTGFERADPRITKETLAKDFSLIYKIKLEENARGQRSVTPPMIINTLISYRGFKELAFSGGSNNTVYAVNADFGKMFWQKQLIYSSELPQARETWLPCSSTVTPMVSLVPPPAFGAGRGGRGPAPPAPAAPPASGAGRGAAAAPASSAPATPPPPPRGLGGAGFGASRPVLALGSDGRLHRLNSANGDDLGGPPTRFLPPNARASMLNVADNVVYTSTNQGCGAVANGIWAIDFAAETPTVTSFKSNGGGVWGSGGVAIGPDQTIYAQLGDGPLDPDAKKFSNTLMALAPRTLEVKQYFTPPNLVAAKNIGMNSATPVVFPWKDRTLIAASGRDGRVYLLDGTLVGGADHKTSLSKSAALSDGATADRGIYGMASWADENQNRWVLAAVWGPVAGSPGNLNGGVVAFKVEDKEGMPVLTQAWVSRDMTSPVPPVIASGVVFALSAGEYTRTPKEVNGIHTVEERPKPMARATLVALDAVTGKDIWSSRQQILAPGALTGLTVANARVYFGTTDGTFYCFGNPMEH